MAGVGAAINAVVVIVVVAAVVDVGVVGGVDLRRGGRASGGGHD